ncbi:MAG: T9SS type A sorting domain-containing protein [Muribaculaceae bacterium]
MKTKLLIAALALASCLASSAKDVFFFSGDATEATKTVSNVTSIIIGDQKLSLKTADQNTTDVAFTEFSAFAFKNQRTSGVGVTKADLATRISCNGTTVAVTSLNIIDAIDLYAVNGAKIASFTPRSRDFQFPIDNAGIYIVKVKAGADVTAFKVVK